ncbi:MAG: recombinase family protein [Alphaproteobacteria bacterium]|nr:recombinase family protein [Alphaproteobacteria bacterium]
MKVIGYIRVSTDQQNCANQRFEIETYCQKQNWKVDEFVEETISSRKELKKRKLNRLLDKLDSDTILIVTEISRIGRNLMEVMGILQDCLEKGCRVITIKENFHLGSDIQSKFIACIFSLVAEMERQLISQRTKESLKRIKNEGKHLGRPYGFSYRKLQKKHNKIKELLNKKVPKTQIAKRIGCSWTTLHRYINENIE